MELIYVFGMISSITILGTVLMGCLFVQLAYNSFAWVNDKKCKPTMPFAWVMKKDYGWDTTQIVLVGLMVVLGVGLIWPIAYLGIFIYGMLYSARKFKRFQKKIEKALKGKSNVGHTHKKG